MKYAIVLIFVSVASAQFSNDGFRDFDNQRGFSNPPLKPIQQTTFSQPQFTSQPIRPTFTAQPVPVTRPATVFTTSPINPIGQKYNPNTRNEAAATIVKQYFDDQGNGAISWGFQASDGSERQERIYFKNGGELGQILVKEGFYSYYDSDARLVKVTYRADENGFQVSEDNRLVVVA